MAYSSTLVYPTCCENCARHIVAETGVQYMGNTAKSEPAVVQRAPVEILELIFLASLPESMAKTFESHGVVFPPPSTRDGPMLYSQICRSWRDVALSTPRLWACVSIPAERNYFAWIEEWLKRSKSVPLHFQWSRDCTNRNSHSHILDKKIKFLVAESTRWHEVIIGDKREVVQQLLAPLKCRVPMLEAQKVYETGYYGVYDVDITAAPNLRYLHVSTECQLTYNFDNKSIRQFIVKETPRSLSSWSSSLMTPNGILQLFSVWPRLESVDIDVVGMTIEPDFHQLTMPSLQKLSLGHGSNATPIDIGRLLLDKLNLPALKSLSIDIYRGKWATVMPLFSIQSLVIRSHASLASLSLYGPRIGQPVSEDDLIGCVLHMPGLEFLLLKHMPISDAFITALTTTPRSPDSDYQPMLCPVLKHLTLGSSAALTENVIIEMIRSRWEHTTHPLCSVHFISCTFSPSGGANLRYFGESEAAKEIAFVLEVNRQSKTIDTAKPVLLNYGSTTHLEVILTRLMAFKNGANNEERF
ncbi:hypothetical protein BD410DRAFT_901162 [Rickenella mellea]|uniref:F-box domain-containing protein n=1 Tax=Rickenella mellea TaxID=50990 RepID=A0A4Y7PSX0_9AGAM|nr:hypothetical protein BD410DRAFT_901162 [Rickenella mellea]